MRAHRRATREDRLAGIDEPVQPLGARPLGGVEDEGGVGSPVAAPPCRRQRTQRIARGSQRYDLSAPEPRHHRRGSPAPAGRAVAMDVSAVLELARVEDRGEELHAAGGIVGDRPDLVEVGAARTTSPCPAAAVRVSTTCVRRVANSAARQALWAMTVNSWAGVSTSAAP